MSFAQLHDASREYTAARNIARALNHWHVMDMTLVERQGHIRVGKIEPRGQTGRLIDWGVLKPAYVAEEYRLVKGPRFDAVCRASRDIYEAQLTAAEAQA